MRTLTVLLVLLAAVLGARTALAASKSVTLDVPGMNCAMCPITVKKALQKVNGVEDVAVSYEKKEAVVTFDDARTTIDALMKASMDAGYPATSKTPK